MKRIAIFLDGSPNDGDSLACAVGVCRAIDGRLTVIHPRQPDQYISTGGGEFAGAVIDNRERAAAAAAAARQAYDSVCAGLAFAEWLETTASAPGAIAGYGLVHDLTILERISSEQGPEVLAFNTALFDTGGPVLVTPPNVPAVVGRHIAIAWAARVPSARAVRRSPWTMSAPDERSRPSRTGRSSGSRRSTSGSDPWETTAASCRKNDSASFIVGGGTFIFSSSTRVNSASTVSPRTSWCSATTTVTTSAQIPRVVKELTSTLVSRKTLKKRLGTRPRP